MLTWEEGSFQVREEDAGARIRKVTFAAIKSEFPSFFAICQPVVGVEGAVGMRGAGLQAS